MLRSSDSSESGQARLTGQGSLLTGPNVHQQVEKSSSSESCIPSQLLGTRGDLSWRGQPPAARGTCGRRAGAARLQPRAFTTGLKPPLPPPAWSLDWRSRPDEEPRRLAHPSAHSGSALPPRGLARSPDSTSLPPRRVLLWELRLNCSASYLSPPQKRGGREGPRCKDNRSHRIHRRTVSLSSAAV